MNTKDYDDWSSPLRVSLNSITAIRSTGAKLLQMGWAATETPTYSFIIGGRFLYSGLN